MTEIRDFKLDILKQEINNEVSIIGHFDDLRHRTKQMGITLWVAAVGFGLSQNPSWVLYLAAFIPFPFWILDTFYSAYQQGFLERFWAINVFIREGKYNIESQATVNLADCLKDDGFGEFPVPDYYGIKTVGEKVLKSETSMVRHFFDWRMALFYLPQVIAALLFVLLR
jgi:hypothetical protein